MSAITNWDELNATILQLESKQTKAEWELREQLKVTYESLRPVNLLKSTFKELVIAPDFKENLWNTSISLATGYISKKLAIGSSHNPIKQILGSVLQMGVTSAVSHHADSMRSKLIVIAGLIFKRTAKKTTQS